MAKDAVDRIKQAESEAASLLEQAEKAAKEKLQSAKADGEALLLQHKEKAAENIRALESETDKKIAEIEESGQKEGDKLLDACRETTVRKLQDVVGAAISALFQ